MRSRLALFAFCAMSACLSASLASAAAAKTEVEFDVSATNGYSASFDFSGRTASVETWRIPSPDVLLTVTYLSRSRIEGNRVRARFGSRGRVAVEFRKSGKVERRWPPRRCEGEPRVTRPGVFVGTIRFNGEGGYTSLDAIRAEGNVRVLPRWRCKKRNERSLEIHPLRSRLASPSAFDRVPLGLDPEAERFTVLDAEADDRSTSFTVRATRLRGRPGSTVFLARRSESRPSLYIIRFAAARGSDETFRFDEALSTASAAPPAPPFAGTADFIRDSGKVCVRYPCDRSSWLGPLSVDFPGADDVPLAGEGFRARLFREGLDGSIVR